MLLKFVFYFINEIMFRSTIKDYTVIYVMTYLAFVNCTHKLWYELQKLIQHDKFCQSTSLVPLVQIKPS
jgi:hypothetical protein